MAQILLISFGAAAASALMFAALATGSFLSIGLFYLAPLPILLAGIVWSYVAAFAAAGIAAAALGLFLGPWFIFAYLVGAGLPAAVLAYLTLLARPSPATPNELEWFPAGRLVLAAALIAAFTVSFGILAFGVDFESYQAAMRRALERVLRLQTNTPADLPLKLPGGDPERVITLLTVALPPAAAALMMSTGLLNLWIAGRIARASGRLKRPWPNIHAMTFPGITPIVLVGAVALSLTSGMVSLVATILSATLLMAYAILGFAVLHGVTVGMTSRTILLAMVWFAVFTLGWPLTLVAVLGLADSALGLRARIAARRGPPTLPNQSGNPNP
jgi:hypothetical protein